jgi:hypothetical protein
MKDRINESHNPRDKFCGRDKAFCRHVVSAEACLRYYVYFLDEMVILK